MQLGSDAVFSAAGSSHSLPAHLPPSLGVAVYRAVEPVAPAPYVEAMLARAAFDRGNLDGARLYALRLPPSPRRDDLLAHIAQARGDDASAQRYFIAAADVFGVAKLVDALAQHDAAAAYRLELQMKDRLAELRTHPDAVAESYWRLGQLATLRGYRGPGGAPRMQWFLRGMSDYRRAVALSPLTEKYLLAAGSQALNIADMASARRFFRRAADVDPASADAYAGMGIAALKSGDRAAAIAYAARARAYDPNAGILHTLESQLK